MGFRLSLMLGSAALACVPQIAYAQDAATSQDGSGLEEIVVTAQKRSENLQDVPVAVTALAGSLITNSRIDASENLPRLTPGLSVNRNANFVGLFLRGVGTLYANPGLESSVAMYLDDTYMPRTATAAFSFNDIERIEVLKGPQGTLYGRNAAAGAVKVVTKDPKIGEWEGAASLTYGRFNRTSADALINIPLADNLAARASIIYDANDGYVKTSDPLLPRLQDRHLFHATGKLLYEPTDNLTIKLSGDYGVKRDREGQAFTNLEDSCADGQIGLCLGGTAPTGFYENGQDYLARRIKGDKMHTINGGAALRADLDLGAATLSSITAYRYYKFTGGADLDGTSIPFLHALTDGERTKSFSQEVQLVSDNSGPLKYVVGLYYYKEKSWSDFNIAGMAVNSQLGINAAPTSGSVYDNPYLKAVAAFNIESWAPYAQATYDINDQFSLTAGLRYTSERKRQLYHDLIAGIPGSGTSVIGSEPAGQVKFNKLTPKIVLDFKPSNDVLFYASFSRGFKSGGINSPSTAVPSDRVTPEVLDSYELGWKTEMGNVRFNGAAFFYDYSNLQVTQTSLACGGSCVVNAATAEVKGVEADLTWAAARGLEFGLGASYLDTKFKKYVGDTYVLSSTTSACSAALATPGTDDDAACLGYTVVSGVDHSGSRLPQAPKLSGYARASYTLELPSAATIRFDTLYSYTGKIFYGPDASYGTEKSRNMVSGSVTYTTADEKFSLSVFGDNLLNEKYRVNVSRQQTGGWYVPGAPITWGVKAGVKF
ncbi:MULTISPECIES: TonB-dependent receptor [Sphingobium]|uniref:TonB-dependent receptor n=1 Tax=Sphingobium sp. MI1205 TaxID=407020 RepID=UPI00076FF9DB|nr:TonB-dependent receptor [Sphingobium sp. MI1205]AMK19895.1 TonB-dependent receptor [Sphingobium sp. MI1205]